MPIMSYLAYAVPGRCHELVDALRPISECELHQPEHDADLLVLVTDTPDGAAEKRLHQQLEEIDSLLCLALVFGHRVELDEAVSR